MLSQTIFNRRVAAEKQVTAVRAAYDTGTVTLDLLLQAQRVLADAESAYYDALSLYNLAISQVHLRKGSLLEYCDVYLAEGPWAGKAYFDARKRARERDAGVYIDYGFTRPNVFSRGPINQQTGVNMGTPTSERPTNPSQPRPAETPETPADATSAPAASLQQPREDATSLLGRPADSNYAVIGEATLQSDLGQLKSTNRLTAWPLIHPLCTKLTSAATAVRCWPTLGTDCCYEQIAFSPSDRVDYATAGRSWAECRVPRFSVRS
jgi:hypothetical protein